jgi:hypothetical protein
MKDTPETKSPWGRLALTLLSVPLLLLGEQIPLPTIDTSALAASIDVGSFGASSSGWDSAVVSVLALGITPILSAFLLVELAALIVPAWSRLRHAGPAGRQKLVKAALILTLVLALFQGFAYARMLESIAATAMAGGLKTTLMNTLTLAAGTFLLLALASLLDRYGLTSGIGTLIVASIAIQIAQRIKAWVSLNGMREGGPSLVETAVPLAAVAAVAALTLAALGALPSRSPAPASEPSEGEAQIGAGYRTPPQKKRPSVIEVPVPASGILPLTISASLLSLPSTLESFGVPLGGFKLGMSGQFILKILLTIPLAIGVGYLLNHPAHLATLALRQTAGAASRDSMETAAASRLRRAIGRTVLFLLAALVIDEVSARFGHAFIGLDVVVVTALVADVLAEWRARRQAPDLVAVWSEHRPYAVGPARAALAKLSIFSFARGAHQRTLLQLFGPYLPIDILVPAPSAESARAELARALSPDTGDALDEKGYSNALKGHARGGAADAEVASKGKKRGESALGAIALVACGALLLLYAMPVRIPSDPSPLQTDAAEDADPGPPVSLEIIALDDDIDPLGDAALELPRGASIQAENAPAGPGKTRPVSFARIIPLQGESMDQAIARVRPWLDGVPLPPGHRFLLGKFYETNEDTGASEHIGLRTYVAVGAPELTNADIAGATATSQSQGGYPDDVVVRVELTESGAARFEALTTKNVKRRIAIVVGGLVESAPVIMSPIPGGQVQISLGPGDPAEKKKEASRLARALRSRRP